MTIFNGYYLDQGRVIIWSKLGVHKKANLDQIVTIRICARKFFYKSAETPIVIVFLTSSVK